MNKNPVENKVFVNIYGEEYPITGVTDTSYISKIADIVDTKMKETAKASRATSRDKVAILAAMSIASELYEKKESLNTDHSKFNAQIDNLLVKVDRALAGVE